MGLQMQDREASEAPFAAAPLQVAGIALAVRDLERVTAFYRDVVGLAVLEQGTDTVHLGAGGVRLVQLLSRPAALPDDPGAAGLFHTAFLLPSRAALGAWLNHARAAGLRLDGAADHLVSEAVYLSDPEGNGVEIYADRPASAWDWTGAVGARRLSMANSPLDIPGLMASATMPWMGAPEGSRIGHVHLRVGDLAQANRFYVDMLGLDIVRAVPEAVFLSTGGYHHHVAANIWRSPGAGPRDPGRAGLAWIVMEAVDATAAAAIAARSHADDLAGVGLQDPWGTQIKVTTAITTVLG